MQISASLCFQKYSSLIPKISLLAHIIFEEMLPLKDVNYMGQTDVVVLLREQQFIKDLLRVKADKPIKQLIKQNIYYR